MHPVGNEIVCFSKRDEENLARELEKLDHTIYSSPVTYLTRQSRNQPAANTLSLNNHRTLSLAIKVFIVSRKTEALG